MGGKPAENATFLNTRDTQHEPQFLSGVATRASAELQGPTQNVSYQVTVQKVQGNSKNWMNYQGIW